MAQDILPRSLSRVRCGDGWRSRLRGSTRRGGEMTSRGLSEPRIRSTSRAAGGRTPTSASRAHVALEGREEASRAAPPCDPQGGRPLLRRLVLKRDVEGAPRAAAPDDEYEAPARRRLAPEGERWRRRAAPPCLCAERQRLLESDLSRDYLSRVCSLALNRSLSGVPCVSDRHSDAQFWPNSKRKNDT